MSFAKAGDVPVFMLVEGSIAALAGAGGAEDDDDAGDADGVLTDAGGCEESGFLHAIAVSTAASTTNAKVFFMV
ncbi:MAG: hypothetical protein M3Y30_05900 [Gemmatimonadota bacterium]|nr:hypothetical protein [Gemmatimonadota bacterium]